MVYIRAPDFWKLLAVSGFRVIEGRGMSQESQQEPAYSVLLAPDKMREL